MRYPYPSSGRSRFKRWLWPALLAAVVLAGAGWLAVNRWYSANLRPLTEDSRPQIVLIELGASTVGVAEQLEELAVIRSARAFIWYVNRLADDQVIQAGTYRLDSASSVPDIVEVLVEGRVDTTLVTIPPGLRLDEVRQVLINAGFDAAEVDKALAADYDHPLMRYRPAGASLEGYVYPETYQITAASTPADILLHSFDLFHERLTPGLLSGLKQAGLSVHQAIILASIIEEEVPDPPVRRMVAQVFLRRLDQDIPLGADPTFRYAAAVSGQEATPDLDSPYNTRIHAGLPPGPIANFNLSALAAVADPAEGDYLYFVSGDDGQTHFARTQAEHEANVAEYCRELCQL